LGCCEIDVRSEECVIRHEVLGSEEQWEPPWGDL